MTPDPNRQLSWLPLAVLLLLCLMGLLTPAPLNGTGRRMSPPSSTAATAKPPRSGSTKPETLASPADSFVVVVTFSMHPGVKVGVVRCPSAACVEEIIATARADRNVSRVQVWDAAHYSPLPTANQYVWPPIRDEQFS